MPQRVWFENDRNKESLIDNIRGQFDLIGGDQIAFPEFERPAAYRSLIANRAHDETTVRLQIVILKKHLTTFQREISAVHEVFVKGVALRVDVIDAIAVLSVNNEQHVRQRVRRIWIIDDRERIEFGARVDGGQ